MLLPLMISLYLILVQWKEYLCGSEIRRIVVVVVLHSY